MTALDRRPDTGKCFYNPATIGFLVLIFAFALCGLPVHLSAQGFGKFEKDKIVLHRKLPPVVHFAGTTFNIKAGAQNPKYADAAATLKDLLETELLKDNDRLRVDANSPELAITCTVISLAAPPPQPFTRNEVVVQKGKKQDVEQPVKYNKVTAQFEVAYQARDTHTARILDADNVTANYSEDFEAGTNQQGGKSLSSKAIDPFKRMAGKKTEDSSGPPSASELQGKLVHDVVHTIAARVTATNEPVEVFLAQGKLDKLNKIAQTGLWSRYLEEVEQMPPLPDPKDDAYRIYDSGVAYEALAYQSEDHEAAKKMLQEAAIRYGKAVDAKPEEKYFLEPQKRIETAMAYYRKIDGQQKAVAAANAAADAAANPAESRVPDAPSAAKTGSAEVTAKSPSTPAKPVRSSGTAAAKPPASPAPSKSTTAQAPAPPKPAGLTNDQIIKMSKAGVDEDSILATIHDAAAVNFDLTPEGQIQLTSGGVKAKILAAMRQRAKLAPRRAAN